MNKYVPITDTQNLEARLAKAVIELERSQLAETKQDKPKKKRDKINAKKIIHNICLAILGILAICLIGISIISAQQQAEINEIANLQDARLISYENQIYEVKKLALLFAIYDDTSYQRAKMTSNLSDELYSAYFVNEHYNKTETPIEIEYQDIQYEITENDYVNYLLTFKRTQGSDIRQYIIQAEFIGDTCVYFDILN